MKKYKAIKNISMEFINLFKNNSYKKNVELLYHTTLRLLLVFINPFKKILIRTECKVHLFNNFHALHLLDKFSYYDEFNFFQKYIEVINHGSYWADQNFKSMSHFYNPYNKRGLYGQKNALYLAKQYYKKCISYYKKGDVVSSMFYLGATVHLIQDVTIPQHVNIKLLDSHRQYENFVKYSYNIVKEYVSIKKPLVLDSVEDYVIYNSKKAININRKHRNIKPSKLKFHKITLISLPLAQQTTAGFFILFYREVVKNYQKQY